MNTSDYEGFGNVFLEAWRYATPVVSLHYDLDGVISEQPVGIVAETTANLVKVVDELHRDVDRRAEMGANGRERLVERYSLESVVDAHVRLFESLVTGP